MTKAKEKPIIFSGPSIPAIQNLKPDVWPPEPIDPGKPWKWQTRRIVPEHVLDKYYDYDEYCNMVMPTDIPCKREYGKEYFARVVSCPPGTRLWVKEAWQPLTTSEGIVAGYHYEDGLVKWLFDTTGIDLNEPGGWRSPRFMPKAAARLWLEVKSARVERLQNINHEDAIAEGTLQWICEEHKSGSYLDNAMRGAACAKPERAFALLWDSINAKRGYPWENNPWVWVYEFMRTEARP